MSQTVLDGKEEFDMPSSSTVRLRWLGAQLRRMRENADLTLEEVAERMDRTAGSLSKVETGRVRVRLLDLRVLLDLYEADERIRGQLLALARDARKRGWWQGYGDVLSSAYQDFISLESDAAALRSFELILIPGLLQTEDYAHALYEAVPTPRSRKDIDQLVAVRIARQKILASPKPLHLWAILDESALHRRVGGRDVMRTQLERLAGATAMENVTVQVLPYSVGAHAGVNCAFTIIEFPDWVDLDVVVLEHLTSGLYLEEEEDIRRYNLVFDHLRASALSEPDTAALIKQALKDL